MLNDLGCSYWQFTVNIGASILTQFFTLSTWGYICDRWGNRLVMVISCCMPPVLPSLWLFSDNYYHLLGVQVIGAGLGGFTLSTSELPVPCTPRGRFRQLRRRPVLAQRHRASSAHCWGLPRQRPAGPSWRSLPRGLATQHVVVLIFAYLFRAAEWASRPGLFRARWNSGCASAPTCCGWCTGSPVSRPAPGWCWTG